MTMATENQNNLSSKVLDAAGKQNGLEIWRIEKDSLITIPQTWHGMFFEGEAYLLLRTSTELADIPKLTIHYWIGSAYDEESDSTESNGVELFENVSNAATQYREMQGFESTEFEKYFKNGIIYLNGKVPKETPAYERVPHFNVKRLFRVDGQVPCRAQQVEFDWSSFVDNQVLLIDIGNVLTLWKGSQSIKKQRVKVHAIANVIKEAEREGLAYIHTINHFENPHDVKIMEELCGPCPDAIPCFKQPLKKETYKMTIFKLQKGDGVIVELNEERFPELNKRCLLADECYLFDLSSNNKVFVWKGSNAENDLKELLWDVASNYIAQTKVGEKVQVQVMESGNETEDFIGLFMEWSPDDFNKQNVATRRYSFLKPKKFDRPAMPGDGKGTLEVLLWNTGSLTQINPKNYGRFYSCECYVVRYSYAEDDVNKQIVYYWEGRRSGQSLSSPTGSSSAIIPLKRRIKGVTECRVELGKEPAHFIAFFQGKFRILKGKDPKSTNTENVSSPNLNKVKGVTLYVIKGTNLFNTKAIQVPCGFSSLNSNYPFLCVELNEIFLWSGKGCIGDQRDMAHFMAENWDGNRGVTVVEENNESKEFSDLLGGTSPYKNIIAPKEPEVSHSVRTYVCSPDKNGSYIYSEVYDLSQNDLKNDDVILIDIYDEVYVWLGREIEDAISSDSFQIAFKFLSKCLDRSDMKTAVLVVKQGFEPSIFTRLLPNWEQQQNNEVPEVRLTSEAVQRLLINRYGLPTFSKQELSNGCPEGVDPGKKERHLSEQEFLQIFRMTREEFAKRSEWTRNDMKKQFQLF